MFTELQGEIPKPTLLLCRAKQTKQGQNWGNWNKNANRQDLTHTNGTCHEAIKEYRFLSSTQGAFTEMESSRP